MSSDKEIDALEEKMFKNQQKFDQISRRSFILSKLEAKQDSQEVEIVKRINRNKKMVEETKVIKEAQFNRKEFWMAIMRRHYDLAGWVMLDVTSNFFLYFFDSIKTRTQAKNRFRDISYFEKNDIKKLPLYAGVHYKLGYVMLSDILRSATNRIRYDPNSPIGSLNLFNKIFLHGVLTEMSITTLLLPIELRKCLIQMGQTKIDISQYVKGYMRCFMPALLRDSIFFLTHSMTFNLLYYQESFIKSLFGYQEFIPPKVNIVGEREKKFTCMMLSLTLCCLITNPFEVLVSKIATQQEFYQQTIYRNPIQAFRQVYTEEGLGKLLSSAISARLGFYFMKGFIFFTYQDKVMELFSDAFDN